MTRDEFEKIAFRYLWLKAALMFICWQLSGVSIFFYMGVATLAGIRVCMEAVLSQRR